MKKIICFILTIIFSLFIFGCSKSEDNKLNIVAVSFADYEFSKVLCENLDYINVHYLLKNGEDSHSYQATFQDKMLFSKADLVVYSGGESVKWVDELIPNTSKKVVYSEFLTPFYLDHDETCNHENEHNHTVDEHYSLSIKNSILIVRKIKETLSEIDEMHSRIFSINGDLYINQLNLIDQKYQTLKSGQVIVADRQPFNYLFNDYGVKCSSAFSSCSAEIDCSFATIVELANKLNEFSLKNILVTENGSLDIASSVISKSGATGVSILRLNSMQSIKINSNLTYLDICKQNYEILKTCLGVNNG